MNTFFKLQCDHTLFLQATDFKVFSTKFCLTVASQIGVIKIYQKHAQV